LARLNLFAIVLCAVACGEWTGGEWTAEPPSAPPLPPGWPAVRDALRSANTIRALVEEPDYAYGSYPASGRTYEVYAQKQPPLLAMTGGSIPKYEWRNGVSKELHAFANRDATGAYVPGFHFVTSTRDNGAMVQQLWTEFQSGFANSEVTPYDARTSGRICPSGEASVEIKLPFPWAQDVWIVVTPAPGGLTGSPPIVTHACVLWKETAFAGNVLILDLNEPLPVEVVSDPWAPVEWPLREEWAIPRWRSIMSQRPGWAEVCAGGGCGFWR
jgi:hypothetical protein